MWKDNSGSSFHENTAFHIVTVLIQLNMAFCWLFWLLLEVDIPGNGGNDFNLPPLTVEDFCFCSIDIGWDFLSVRPWPTL